LVVGPAWLILLAAAAYYRKGLHKGREDGVVPKLVLEAK
jgi:hypothetical protein